MRSDSISIQALVSVSPSNAWDYYTKPEHIVNWNFASDDWQCPSASNDMRVGGKYIARMEAKDGSWGFDFELIYNAITPGESFTYTMEDGREVQVTFRNHEQKTEVTVTFDPETQNPVEMQRGGWQAILDNYKKYAEKLG